MAATRPAVERESWKVEVPQQGVAVTIAYPKGWVRAQKDGPMLYKPGTGKGEMEAFWDFDIKTGSKGRTLEQWLDQLAVSAGKGAGISGVKKEIITLANGKKAAVLTMLRTDGNSQIVWRQVFYALDDNRVLAMSEYVPSPRDAEYREILREISESVSVVELKAK